MAYLLELVRFQFNKHWFCWAVAAVININNLFFNKFKISGDISGSCKINAEISAHNKTTSALSNRRYFKTFGFLHKARYDSKSFSGEVRYEIVKRDNYQNNNISFHLFLIWSLWPQYLYNYDYWLKHTLILLFISTIL